MRLPPWSASDSGTLNLKKERTEISELPKTKLVIYVFQNFQNSYFSIVSTHLK